MLQAASKFRHRPWRFERWEPLGDDPIHMRGLRSWAHVGVLEEERQLGQWFRAAFSASGTNLQPARRPQRTISASSLDYALGIQALQAQARELRCLTLGALTTRAGELDRLEQALRAGAPTCRGGDLQMQARCRASRGASAWSRWRIGLIHTDGLPNPNACQIHWPPLPAPGYWFMASGTRHACSNRCGDALAGGERDPHY